MDPAWRPILRENRRHRCPFGDMMQLDPSEFVLELTYLLAVCCHEGGFAGGLLHDLVNDQLRVTADVEPRSAELDGDA